MIDMSTQHIDSAKGAEETSLSKVKLQLWLHTGK